MKLKNLLEVIDPIQIQGDINGQIEIKDISYDSRKTVHGSIFLAIKGYQTDGHKYIRKAKEKGALLALVEEFIEDDIPQIRVKNTRESLADISAKFYNYPSNELFTVGITASNGKTTTAFMTNEIFKSYGLETGLSGTVAIEYKDQSIPSLLTTPESRDLQYYLREMLDKGISDFIMEVSSHALEMSRVRQMDFDVISFNNLSREHIDQHGSFENYMEIKSRLVKNASPESFVILNHDEDYIRSLENQTKGRVLTYSLNSNKTDFSLKNIDISSGYGKFIFSINRDIDCLQLKRGEFPIELGVAGYSGVMNSAVAIIISLIRGIEAGTIQKALKSFKGVERRFQIIYNKDFSVLDDHFANVRNISVSMDTISKMDYKKLYVLYAIRGNRGVNLNKESAEEMAKWFKALGLDQVYSTSSEDFVSDKDRVFEEEREAFLQVMGQNDIRVNHDFSLKDSIIKITKKLQEGDLLLLAGCQGMDHGAEILLNEISKDMKDHEKRELLKVLDGRNFI